MSPAMNQDLPESASYHRPERDRTKLPHLRYGKRLSGSALAKREQSNHSHRQRQEPCDDAHPSCPHENSGEAQDKDARQYERDCDPLIHGCRWHQAYVERISPRAPLGQMVPGSPPRLKKRTGHRPLRVAFHRLDLPMKKRHQATDRASNRNNPTKPTREELRTRTTRVNSPRQSSRPVERSGQRRSH